MIKLKEILHSIKFLMEDGEPEPQVSNFIPDESKKSINDEFKVNDWMLAEVEKMLEKVNKKLKARNMPELKLNILNTETVSYRKQLSTGLSSELYTKPVHTIKIEGDIPAIKDYEFIAKIEHSSDGNIINMAPNSSVEKLPDTYKFANQKCDICKTDRERFNTFIIKKVDTGELICAGSGCLKKFMPLDIVKAMVDYAIQLQDIRNVLTDYEEELKSGEYRGGHHVPDTYEPKTILTFCLIAFLDNGKQYISKQKAMEWGKNSTLGEAMSIIDRLESFPRTDAEKKAKREAEAVVEKYQEEAKKMAEDVLTWAHEFDFDTAAKENPAMDSYYHNLKVLLGRRYLEAKHLGYFSSIISLYLRAMNIKADKKEKKENTYYGNIGDKIVDIPVELKFSTWFETAFGTMFLYSFYDDEGHVFVYKGKSLALSKGDKVLLSGTIKDHQQYKDTKQTIIQRPKIKQQ